MPSVVQAQSGESDRVAAVMTTAFASDPVLRWVFPDPHQYVTYFPQLMRAFGVPAFEHDSVHRASDFKAAALWLPPGAHADDEALGALMGEALEPVRQEHVFSLLGQMGEFHPEAEHWYLPAIGVDPRCQGMGYGSALLAHALEICDRDHHVAYLESSNPRNIPLYQRFGFEITGTIQAGDSPEVVPMVRPAR